MNLKIFSVYQDFLIPLPLTTDGIIHKLVMVFAKAHPTLMSGSVKPGQSRRSRTVNKFTASRLILNHLETLYLDTRNVPKLCTLIAKTHAVPSLRRDKLSAKAPGSLPALMSGNACEIIPPGR